MTMQPDHLLIAWWIERLEELDREIARMAILCQVNILERGVIERVLRDDESVCGTTNSAAFRKLHDLLVMHFLVRKRSADELGQVQTAQIEHHVVEEMKKLIDERPVH